jgi:two-component system, OmpR family, phosphate regulon response regulator PhoB
MTHTIMLVDDDQDLRMLMGLILKREGYNVIEARDAQVALHKLETTVPDLFILDIMMPGMNGYDLCKHLKATEETAHLPVVLLSARGDEASMFEGLESGANLYLVKPLATEDLITRIQQFLTTDVAQDVSL